MRLKYIAIFLGIFIGLPVLFNAMGVFTSVATAPGRVIQKTMETDNIVHSYEWFYDVHGSYQARYEQVQQFDSLMKSETDASEKRRIRIELTAMQQTCRKLVAQYNANSLKMNKKVFKGWSLPTSLSLQNCNVTS